MQQSSDYPGSILAIGACAQAGVWRVWDPQPLCAETHGGGPGSALGATISGQNPCVFGEAIPGAQNLLPI